MLIAHAGHWLAWMLYAVPVLIVLGSIVIGARRDRSEERSSRTQAGGRTEPPRAPDPDR